MGQSWEGLIEGEYMGDVMITYTVGDVYLERGDKKRKIEAIPSGKNSRWVRLKDGDRIGTVSRSYVVHLSDDPGPRQTGTVITAFPNSELSLRIKGIITAVELICGLFKIATEKEVITPTAELRFPQGPSPFWIDVAKDGTVVVASEAVPMEIVHKKTKRGAVINSRQQVTVTQEDILQPCDVDQRFKEAYRVEESLKASEAKFLYGDMLEGNAAQELQKICDVVGQKTGRKIDGYDPAKYQKWLKEQKEFGEWKLDEAVESELPEFKPQKQEEKTAPIVKPTIMDINKIVSYQGVDFKLASAEKGQEFKGRNAPEGKDFLVINIEAKNNSAKQVFVFYDEESRLINESDETIVLENYKLESSFEPQFENKGFLLFIVAKADKKFKLQLGKKSLPKVEVEFEFPEE